MTDYIVRDKAGNFITACASIAQGEEIIKMYEAIDKDARIFTPAFYEIAIRYKEADGSYSYFGI